MTARLVPSILAAVLLIGACSPSDDAAAPSTTAPSTTAPDTTPGTASSTTAATIEPTSTSGPGDTDTGTTPPPTTAAPPVGTAPSSTGAPSNTSGGDSGSGGDEDGGDDTFTGSEETDRGAARTALITLALFPDDWVEEPVEDEQDDPGTAEFEAAFDACLGRDGGEQVGDGLDRLKVRTGDFHPANDDTITVSHEVVLAPDDETALAAMAEVRIDGAEQCLADVIGDFYAATFADDPELAEVGIGDVLVTRTESDRDPDVAVGVLLEVPLTIGDQTVSQFLELLYQRQGRALSELSFSSFGGQFSRDGFSLLREEVGSRIAAIGN